MNSQRSNFTQNAQILQGDTQLTLQEDFFEVDYEMNPLSQQSQFTEITFGHDQTWVKYESTKEWLIKAVQFLIMYIIADGKPKVTLSVEYTDIPKSKQRTSKHYDINTEQQKLCEIVTQKLIDTNKQITVQQKNDIKGYITWLNQINRYYKQDRAKLNVICTKVSQKPFIHKSFIKCLKSYLQYELQQINLQEILIPQTKFFEKFNEQNKFGFKIRGVADYSGMKIMTDRIQGTGYSLYVMPNNSGCKTEIRIRISNSEKQYLSNQQSIGPFKQKQNIIQKELTESLFENSTFMDKKHQQQQNKQAQYKFTKQDSEQELNESIVLESQEQLQEQIKFHEEKFGKSTWQSNFQQQETQIRNSSKIQELNEENFETLDSIKTHKNIEFKKYNQYFYLKQGYQTPTPQKKCKSQTNYIEPTLSTRKSQYPIKNMHYQASPSPIKISNLPMQKSLIFLQAEPHVRPQVRPQSSFLIPNVTSFNRNYHLKKPKVNFTYSSAYPISK